MVPVFAGYHDSYAYMWEDPAYGALIDSVKNDADEDTVGKAYEEYMSGPASDADKSLTEYHMVRYWMDRGNEAEAEKHYRRQEELFGKAEFPSEEARLTAEFDLISSEYYIWHNALTAGLKSSNITKDLYSRDPYEYRNALNEAFRLLSTPHIAGGSPKRGLKLFHEIEKDSDGMSRLDRFSLYSGLGMSSYERKEYRDSAKYFALATEIYPADHAMKDYMERLGEKL